jgi:hypothetical protein
MYVNPTAPVTKLTWLSIANQIFYVRSEESRRASRAPNGAGSAYTPLYPFIQKYAPATSQAYWYSSAHLQR